MKTNILQPGGGNKLDSLVLCCFPGKDINGNDTSRVEFLLHHVTSEVHRTQQITTKLPGRQPATTKRFVNLNTYDVGFLNSLMSVRVFTRIVSDNP